ncbi:helix-turn-helix domain-containing protein [Aliivibrio sp. S3MY1]|uniref:helix-turn-helix domain-containing protein n=1 Tax=Aliivibrio sp. S3MY1 TaxID=3028424 RepID=UPI002379C151|nr:helix-turn-helix domain-containing protein [Aliivibrio sp. S3MY1]MDD9195841.1 helix-turn-helix domain-containing protein [Aliivibrio sp. S3MY1]
MNSRTKEAYFKRMYIAYLISSGRADTQAKIIEVTGLGQRTLYTCIESLADYGIEIVKQGTARNQSYSLISWGLTDPKQIAFQIDDVINCAGCTALENT